MRKQSVDKNAKLCIIKVWVNIYTAFLHAIGSFFAARRTRVNGYFKSIWARMYYGIIEYEL